MTKKFEAAEELACESVTRKQPATNEQLISHLMNFAKSGPMMQAFIIEGLRLYAEQVKNADLSKMARGGFISAEAWKACAVEYVETLDARDK